MIDSCFWMCERNPTPTLPHNHFAFCCLDWLLAIWGIRDWASDGLNNLVPLWALSRLVVLVCV